MSRRLRYAAFATDEAVTLNSKQKTMKNRLKIIFVSLLFAAIIGCGGSGKNEPLSESNTSNENKEVKQTAPVESSPINTENTENIAENKSKPEASKEPELVLGSLKKVVSDGCSCSVRDPADRSKNSGEPKLLFITDLNNDSPAYLNINGKDTKFSLIKRGNRPNDANSKTPYEDVYETDGMIARIKYVFSKSGCPKGEECESSEFDVTITVIKDKEVVTKTAKGICGC